MRTALTLFVVLYAAAAAAEPAQIVGRIVDVKGRELESATVSIGGQHVFTTAHGVYRLQLPDRGTYHVVFDYADGHAERDVTVDAPIATADQRLDVDSDSVIVIHDQRRLASAPISTTDPLREKAPPFSDRMITSNHWAKAWLLLDIDAKGNVTQLKVLNDPGYDLREIAIAEGFKQHFSPGLDEQGNPMSTMLLYPVEWPSYWWLVQISGNTLHIPAKTRYMECRGHGPLTIDSIEPEYRDCTDPDIKAAVTEPWIKRP
jgi:hypothetical protein